MKKILIAMAIAAMVVVPFGVKACWIDSLITVTASNGLNESTLIFPVSGDTGDDNLLQWGFDYTNSPEQQVPILDGFIEKLKLTVCGDPEVGIEFGVRAGNSDTTFSILSEVLTFDAIIDPQALTSAGVSLTDRAGSVPGATITGLFDGKIYQARYNGTVGWANLISTFSVTGNTLTQNESKPLTGSETINDTLTSIESEFYFRLTAKDSAAGTSDFFVVGEPIIPEPGTIMLIGSGLVGLVALLRKRG